MTCPKVMRPVTHYIYIISIFSTYSRQNSSTLVYSDFLTWWRRLSLCFLYDLPSIAHLSEGSSGKDKKRNYNTRHQVTGNIAWGNTSLPWRKCHSKSYYYYFPPSFAVHSTLLHAILTFPLFLFSLTFLFNAFPFFVFISLLLLPSSRSSLHLLIPQLSTLSSHHFSIVRHFIFQSSKMQPIFASVKITHSGRRFLHLADVQASVKSTLDHICLRELKPDSYSVTFLRGFLPQSYKWHFLHVPIFLRVSFIQSHNIIFSIVYMKCVP